MACDLEVDTDALIAVSAALTRLDAVMIAGVRTLPSDLPALGSTGGSGPVREAVRRTTTVAHLSTELTTGIADYIHEIGAKLAEVARAFDTVEDICAGGG